MIFKNPFHSKQSRFYLFPLAFAIIALYPMFGKGMFMDGILYAIISQNVAHDICGLWSLKITDSLYPHFNEHPPLVFALQSGFFQLFGDDYWVERLYSLTTIFISAYWIFLIYKQILQHLNTPQTNYNSAIPNIKTIVSDPLTYKTTSNSNHVESTAIKKTSPSVAWVLLLWISVPVVNRCAQNNMLENTMLIFVLASVSTYIRSLKNHQIFWLLLSGTSLFLAFMTKGFTGLFPFSLPAIFVWVFRNKSNSSIFKSLIIQTVIMLLGFAICFTLLVWIFPESISALQRYFNKQVLGSLEKVQTVSSRFKILGDYILALLPMLVISTVIGWGSVKSKIMNLQISNIPAMFKAVYLKFARSNWSQVLVLLSLTGVLPIMISLKQSDYYIYCVFPFVSISVVIAFKDHWIYLENKLSQLRYWQPILLFLILFFGGWGYAQAGKIQRDKKLWVDVDKIVNHVQKSKKGLVLGSFRALKDDWYLQAYLYRYYGITVQNYRVPNDEKTFDYFLTPKNYNRDSLRNLQPVNLELNNYELWRNPSPKLE